ncbi:MAG: S8 family serine peptidase [Sphingobacteriaceae bacterium]|nr:S8 family serine peptidase [Sphingobacteriaceae bacterium]
MKKNLLLWLTVFGLGIINSFSQTAVPGCVDGKIYLKYKPNAVVKYKNPNDINPKNLPGMEAFIGKYGITSAERPYWMVDDDKDLPRIYKVNFTNIASVEDLIRDISANPFVEYAEKVPEMKTFYTPNDPSFGTQWHLNLIGAQNAWNVFNGTSTVVVAVVDNAIMRTHPDLSANIYTNPGEIAGNSIDDDGNGYVDDVNGYDVGDNDNSVLPLNTTWSHGTHVSGIVGARTDNTVGISAIGFNVRVLPVKATANSAGSNAVTNGYGGIVYAVRTKARVINCSWGGTVSATSDQAVINYAWGKGVIVIVSAGNNGNTVMGYPAAYTNAYSVVCSQASDVKSGFSTYGTWTDITAPGDPLYSTIPNTSYGNMSGTSMASPLVAGLAGLMLSKNGYLTPTQVLNCISSTAANIYTISGNSGYAGQLGAGRINAFAAMTCASVTPGSAPVADFISDKQNTCPLNPIKFTDLSTLFPSAWSWTFQAGSPAISTASAPTVSWTAAGTYSVGLTVTNPFGNGTVTKVGYITISNPTTLPLVEGFQGAAWPPVNWVDDNKGLDSIKWERATTCGGYGLSSASLLFDNYYDDASGIRDGFQMPKLNMSTVTQATVNFDVAFARYDATYSDSLRVMLSTNCGQTWTQIYYKGGTNLATAPDFTTNLFVPNSTQWRTESIVITGLAAGQSNVLMSFVNHGHYGNGIYIDNVNISYSTTAAPIANYNVPASVCSGATMTFTDTSTNSPTSWLWNMPGASVTTSTLQNPTVTYATGGVYSATLAATNGVGTSTVTKTFTITVTPTVVATGAASVCAGSSATLTASGASTYTWNPGSLTGTSVVVTPTATTTYSIVGATGACLGNTTRLLTITPSPTVGVTSSSICAGATATLTASGATTYSWNTGSTATSINPTPTITTNYTVIGTTSGCTNTRTTSVVVTPNPTVSVNNSTICAGGTATLTASGATTYSWSTGSTATSINPTPALTTTYNVVGTTSGCTNIRTATVTVAPNPTVSVNSATICAGNSTNLTASGATTYSWNTSATTSSISVSPTITTNYTVTGSTGSCVNTRTTSVTVNALPSLTLASSSNTACTISSGGITLTLTGTPSGGVYSGPGVVGTTFTAQTAAGTYTTTYSYTNSTTGCANSTVKTITVAVCTGVEGLNIDGELLVYPNPNNGVFTVQANFENAFDVMVYNNIGQLVKEVKELKGVNQIDMSGYAQGIYNIVLRVNDNYKTIKMVIE